MQCCSMAEKMNATNNGTTHYFLYQDIAYIYEYSSFDVCILNEDFSGVLFWEEEEGGGGMLCLFLFIQL